MTKCEVTRLKGSATIPTDVNLFCWALRLELRLDMRLELRLEFRLEFKLLHELYLGLRIQHSRWTPIRLYDMRTLLILCRVDNDSCRMLRITYSGEKSPNPSSLTSGTHLYDSSLY